MKPLMELEACKAGPSHQPTWLLSRHYIYVDLVLKGLIFTKASIKSIVATTVIIVLKR